MVLTIVLLTRGDVFDPRLFLHYDKAIKTKPKSQCCLHFMGLLNPTVGLESHKMEAAAMSRHDHSC